MLQSVGRKMYLVKIDEKHVRNKGSRTINYRYNVEGLKRNK